MRTLTRVMLSRQLSKMAQPLRSMERVRSELKTHDRNIVEPSKRYDSAVSMGSEGAGKSEKEIAGANLPRVASLFDDTGVQMNDGICQIGYKKFDISAPEYAYGEEFDINPTPIASLNGYSNGVVIVGETFGLTQEPARRGNKISITFCVYDGNTSIEVRAYEDADKAELIAGIVKNGSSIALYGKSEIEKKKENARINNLRFIY